MSVSFVHPTMLTLRAAIVLTVVAWVLDVHGRLNIPLYTEQMLVFVLGLSLALTFLTFPFGAREIGEEASVKQVLNVEREKIGPTPLDWALSAASLTTCLYVAVRYPQLIKELVLRPWDGILVATVLVLLVFEATRRLTGWALVLIVLALCAHAMLGWMLPEPFTSRPVSLSRLMVYLGIDTNALLGSTLQIAIVVVTPFIIMGQVLARCGGSDFFAAAGALCGGDARRRHPGVSLLCGAVHAGRS